MKRILNLCDGDSVFLTKNHPLHLLYDRHRFGFSVEFTKSIYRLSVRSSPAGSLKQLFHRDIGAETVKMVNITEKIKEYVTLYHTGCLVPDLFPGSRPRWPELKVGVVFLS